MQILQTKEGALRARAGKEKDLGGKNIAIVTRGTDQGRLFQDMMNFTRVRKEKEGKTIFIVFFNYWFLSKAKRRRDSHEKWSSQAHTGTTPMGLPMNISELR